MKIAYFSPINPIKSGISDFTEELVACLNSFCDISLFVPDEVANNNNLSDKYDIFSISQLDEELKEKYDLCVYHVGNNYKFHHQIVDAFLKYGGVLELHDIALHHYYAEELVLNGKKDKYIELMDYCHGKAGRRKAEDYFNGTSIEPWRNESLKYPMNKHLIDRADAVIVHSIFAMEMVKGVRPDVSVCTIPLHTTDILENPEIEKARSRKELGIPEDKLILGAFGIASKEKQIIEILKALAQYKKYNTNFHFFIVGQVSGIDVDKIVKQEDLNNFVTILGRTELDVFKKYMKAIDIAFNLRYPTQGESSASLVRLLGMGKIVFVNNLGSFREIPDDVVVKINEGNTEIDKLVDGLKMGMDLRKRYEKRALEYAKENFSIVGNTQKYIEFFTQICGGEKSCEEYEDILISKIQNCFGLEEKYICHVADRILF